MPFAPRHRTRRVPTRLRASRRSPRGASSRTPRELLVESRARKPDTAGAGGDAGQRATELDRLGPAPGDGDARHGPVEVRDPHRSGTGVEVARPAVDREADGGDDAA